LADTGNVEEVVDVAVVRRKGRSDASWRKRWLTSIAKRKGARRCIVWGSATEGRGPFSAYQNAVASGKDRRQGSYDYDAKIFRVSFQEELSVEI